MKKEIIEEKKTEEIKEFPFIVRVAMLKEQLVRDIKGNNLPFCVIEPILANIYNQVAEAAAKELANEMATIKKEEG